MNQLHQPAKDSLPGKDRARDLEDYFSRQKGAIIAYSGGVDSALLAYAAHLVLGNRMVAVLADSPSLARREYRHAVSFTERHGIPLQIVHTEEMNDPLYRKNRGNRCYYCKKALFERLKDLQAKIETAVPGAIFYGVNVDDLGDHRPGIDAGREAGIRAPYVDLGFDKAAIRSVCAFYGLTIATKPAMPCMASRIAYGQEVTEEKLSQVEKAEDFLCGVGLTVFRVRHHGDSARIEVPPETFETILRNRDAIRRAFHEIGFIYVSLDLDGFKSGSLNAVLSPHEKQSRM